MGVAVAVLVLAEIARLFAMYAEAQPLRRWQSLEPLVDLVGIVLSYGLLLLAVFLALHAGGFLWGLGFLALGLYVLPLMTGMILMAWAAEVSRRASRPKSRL